MFCNYFHELFEYKVKNIKNYRSLFFTNGTSFERYKSFIDKFEDNVEPFLTLHPTFLKDHQLKEFIKCLEYNIEKFNYCNISFVYYNGLDYDEFVESFSSILGPYKDNINIKVFFDKDVLEENNHKNLLKTYKFMKYLDDEKYKYKKLLSDDYHKDFKSKSTFLFKQDQRENIISKYMAAIEVVDDKISYINLFKDIYEFKNLDEFKDHIHNELNEINHDDIDVKERNVINQLVEIL